MTKRQVLSFAERIKVFEALQKVCKKDEANIGFCIYSSGVTDTSLAKSLGVSEVNVRSIRQEMFGKTRLTRNPDLSLDLRITQIEDYLTRKHPNWKEEL
jgi:hypothetical protein